jgi:quercetin dioxygenase-like cupin family protein
MLNRMPPCFGLLAKIVPLGTQISKLFQQYPGKFASLAICLNSYIMAIAALLEQLETSAHPVAKAIHSGHNFKVLALGFKKGMILKEHQAHLPAKLTVLYGSVVYREADKEVRLSRYGMTDIPVDVIHSVEATEDSLCLLTQG